MLNGYFSSPAFHNTNIPEKARIHEMTVSHLLDYMLYGTGIICSTLASAPELVKIIQGTIAAAAVINEFIAVIAAKKGFELAGEIEKSS